MRRESESFVHAARLAVTLAVLVAAAAGPATALEVCWLADASGELSFVRAQITQGSGSHYLFHGYTYPLPDGEVSPFDGNAGVFGSTVIGMLTKVERRAEGADTWLEAYHGIFTLDKTSKDGNIEGVLTQCLTPPTDPPTCEVLNTGLIELWHDGDCDPDTLPPGL